MTYYTLLYNIYIFKHHVVLQLVYIKTETMGYYAHKDGN